MLAALLFSTLLNVLLTALLLLPHLREWRKRPQGRAAALLAGVREAQSFLAGVREAQSESCAACGPSLKPIKHPKLTGKHVPLHASSMTYYQGKNDSMHEPFLAQHFDVKGVHEGRRVPADSYVITATRAIVPGPLFREKYEIAPVAQVALPVAKRTVSPSDTRPAYQAFPPGLPQMTEEELDQLAKEYELGEAPIPAWDRRRHGS